jgi:D-sedoheptulose 7-phosphate isomerase
MISFSDKIAENIVLAVDMKKINKEVEQSARMLLESINKGGTIYIAGNAGAGSNAEHFTSELMGRFYKTREPIKCVSLNSDTTTITCIANDFGFDRIFSRQLEGLFDVNKDIFIGMSTSGNSTNIVEAVDYLNSIYGKSIILVGKDGGKLNSYSKLFMNLLRMPTNNTPRVQEMHMFVLHYMAEYIEANYNKREVDN